MSKLNELRYMVFTNNHGALFKTYIATLNNSTPRTINHIGSRNNPVHSDTQQSRLKSVLGHAYSSLQATSMPELIGSPLAAKRKEKER